MCCWRPRGAIAILLSRTQAPRVLGRFGMGALTLLLTVLGGTAPHEVSVVSLADLVQQARRAFPDVGSAELSFQAAWHGAHERVFTLDDRNLQLLRNNTEVTVQVSGRHAVGSQQCAEGDAQCAAGAGGSRHGHFSNHRVLSERPRIFYFPHFLDDATCDEMIRLAEPYTQAALSWQSHSPAPVPYGQ